jgi:cytochrome c-type biogenesis protein CcsB
MKFLNQLFSGWLMGVLLIVFATAIGYATFIENDYGAEAAKIMVYNSSWFEFLMLLMVINFSGMIFTKHLYHKSKWNVLIIHLALIIIIIGAGITRYFGSEGQMHIREGKTVNEFRSSDTYLQVRFKNGDNQFYSEDKFILSSAKDNLFSKSFDWKNEQINIAVSNYYPNSELAIEPSKTGDPYIFMVVGGSDGRHEFYLKEGESKILHGFGISFGDTSKREFVTIIREGTDLFIKFPENMIADSASDTAAANRVVGFNPIKEMSINTIGDVSFVVKKFIPHGELQYKVSKDPNSGMPLVKVLVNNQEFMLPNGNEKIVRVNDTEIAVKVGFIWLELPFSLKLDNFDLERYPGSNSPSSFASDVTVIDDAKNVEMPYRIYMNHILNYGGYRFFQSSYDQDEKGTILSVNHDYWGTLITYIGYFILFGSLLATFFTNTSRFKRMSYQLSEVHKMRKSLTLPVILLLLTLSGSSAFAQIGITSPEHAANFGKLFIQNNEGRIEPINTMATKVLVKINKKNTYGGLTADQVFLEIMMNQVAWQEEPIIKVADKTIQASIGVDGDYAAFSDFISKDGKYKILSQVEEANIKKPSMRSTYDKELINVDERLNVFYMVLNGSILKIFPLENDPNNNWVIPSHFHEHKGHGNQDAELYDQYILALKEAIDSQNFQKADNKVAEISNYQRTIANAIIPTETSARLEIFYNKANIFKNLFPFYLMIGILLVGMFFLQTFKPEYELKKIVLGLKAILFWILVIGFIFQSLGLGIRWYISGHAPWSNGYESMIYISWATMLAGFIFMKKSYITLGVTAILAGITLLTAHMNWLNPELTNLVPVLKSYWLTIHVATITASYGFLGLGCLVGFLNLVSMIFRDKNNYSRVNLTLKELTLITEMALSVGLILLIIGNFLGGIWANESWGRYWGWDPKETWTLVTIILYSFTLHLTLIPSIHNSFSFNFMSTLSFCAVLMTYFGVNYYLSGLHSYAGGDSVPVPTFVYYSFGIFLLVSLLAAYNEFRVSKSYIEKM